MAPSALHQACFVTGCKNKPKTNTTIESDIYPMHCDKYQCDSNVTCSVSMHACIVVPDEIHTSLLKFSSFWYNSDSILVFFYVAFFRLITKKIWIFWHLASSMQCTTRHCVIHDCGAYEAEVSLRTFCISAVGALESSYFMPHRTLLWPRSGISKTIHSLFHEHVSIWRSPGTPYQAI